MTVIFKENAIEISKYLRPLEIVQGVNGCCKDRPIILTTNKLPNGATNYSCQCACGGWCTSGYISRQGVIKEYKEMTESYINELLSYD